LREIYFRLKPIETDEYTFYTFESICFKGICALNRRHNLADVVQSDRANPLFLGGGGCSFLSSPQFFLFFRGGCWWEKRALFSLHRKINIWYFAAKSKTKAKPAGKKFPFRSTDMILISLCLLFVTWTTEKAKPASHKEVTGGAKEKQYGAKGQQGDKKKHTSGKHDRSHHGKSSDHKGGAGKGNWGKAGDELNAKMDDAGNESATEQEVEAPSNEISLEEAMRLKEEKKKAVAALAKTGPARAVDTSAFASMAAPKKLEDEENHLDMLKVDAKFRKRGEKEVKVKQTLDLNFKVAPTESHDRDDDRRDRGRDRGGRDRNRGDKGKGGGGRGGDRGRGGRGGNSGGGRGGNSGARGGGGRGGGRGANINVADNAAFPSLG
jgi:plasminogen activator inhibitor 1 RNA-binding protein